MNARASSLTAEPGDEIPEIIATLIAAERRLVELTAGEVDAVAGHDGRTFLLQRAQEQLRQREAVKQRAILNALPAHIALLDARGSIVSVNEAWQRFAAENFLAGPAFGIGVNYLEVCDRALGASSAEASRVAEGIRQVLGGASSFWIEYPCHGPAEPRWFLMTVTPLLHSGALGVVVMHLNITERKLAETALRASEHRFKTLFDQAAVGVALTDAETGRYLQVNRRFCQIVGRGPDELEQLTSAEITHPQDVAYCQEMTRSLQAGTIREYTQEKRYVREDRAEVWANVTISAMWAVGENPDFFIVVAQDITQRKQLEEELRQAHKMEAIGTLAGGIAHDFNNILIAIGGYTELARMKLTDNPRVCEHLDSVIQAVKRAAGMVQQILTFSREHPLERRSIQLLPVMAECVQLLRATMPATIEVDLVAAEDSPSVLADETEIHQILMNLGTNARHALGNRPGRIQIKLERYVADEAHAAVQSQLRPGLYARVSVSDTAGGMDPETLRRIFEPFFTTKAPGEGTGLGLAVVHGIMDSHDGVITVYSQLGEGTVFHLYFPAHAAEAALTTLAEPTVPRGRGERVLFVDDEKLLTEFGEKSLRLLGYEVEVTGQPATALALVRADQQRFAVVVMDQGMPGMTGLQLAAELRLIRSDLPIILTAGYSLTLTAERVRAAGIQQLVLKPTTINSLGAAVHAALSGQPLTTHV